MLKINTLSAVSSIQDLGRRGFLGLGVGRAGVMDAYAFRLGNALLGNDENAPALEISLGGMSATFTKDTTFCVVGATFLADLDGQKITPAYRTFAKKGQTLTLKRMTGGMHGYLCVQGGFGFCTELGSVSCDVKTGLGGLGRYLTAGDELPYEAGVKMSVLGVSTGYGFEKATIIDVVKSSEFERFGQAAQKFTAQPYRLLPESNRMGYRFEGEPLAFEAMEMNSHGVEFGMIQIPPDGKPIVLMADAQTTGGYPKMASVIAADLGRLAQVRFGAFVQFRLVEASFALEKWHAQNAHVQQVAITANR
ncbi:MAG: biotin-dependent carboxyltransferase family protein [Moraxella sp.]|nr:biotin-dependent carboxyltransferase family protein [Moraxella sp.]